MEYTDWLKSDYYKEKSKWLSNDALLQNLLLIQDLDMIPVVTGLDEVKANKNKIIKLSKPQPNTFVRCIE